MTLAPSVIILALVLYGAVLLLIGRMTAPRGDNAAFFTGGRRARWYHIWPAMISAAMSGITFVSVPGSVAADGFTYLQMVAGFTIGQLLIAFWLVPLFYRLRLTSIYEYFALRFGRSTHRTCGWFFLLAKLASASLKLSIVCIVLQQLLFEPLGWPYWATTVAIVAVVWGYTRRSGVGAVIRADWVKTTTLLGALVATFWAVWRALDLSFGELCQMIGSSPMARIVCLDDPASDRYLWKMVVAGVVLLLAMTGLDQDLMQRNLACRSVRDAQKNILLTAVSQAVVIAAFLVLGLLLYRYAAVTEMALPEQPDQLFAAVAVGGGLPAWVGVLFVLGFAAGSFAAGGAALTALTTSAVVDLNDIKSLDERQLKHLRNRLHACLALGMGLLVIFFGYWADESVINLIYRVAGYTYGPILGLFLFGEWTHRQVHDRKVIFVAVLAPVLSATIQHIAQHCLNYKIGFELLLLNALLTMLGLWLIRRPKVTA